MSFQNGTDYGYSKPEFRVPIPPLDPMGRGSDLPFLHPPLGLHAYSHCMYLVLESFKKKNLLH